MNHPVDFIKLGSFSQGHTRLCRWIVYSRATTSEMADRPFFGLVVVALGVVEGLSFGIVCAACSISDSPSGRSNCALV